MKKKILWLNTLLVAMFSFTIALANSNLNIAASPIIQAHWSDAISQDQFKADYAKLPLSFEVNQGQTDAQVKFLSKGSGYSLFLTPTEAVLVLHTTQGKSSVVGNLSAAKPQQAANTSTNVLHMQLLGANRQPQVTGLEPLPGKVNYFLGNDPKQWRTNIPTYAKVQYQQVYPGVDLVYYGNPQQLEYDFVLAPGTDPNIVKLAFPGADQLEVNAQGDLVLQTAGGQVHLHKPLVYQKVNGVRQAIVGGYMLKDQHFVSFRVGDYDPRSPLIVDPVLAYSTYLGGKSNDDGYHIAVDAKSNAYVTGTTASTNFPTKKPLPPTTGRNQDAFVAKLNPRGSALVYSTYLGGSAPDTGFSIAVDAKDNAYVTGTTASTNFPTKKPLQPTIGGKRGGSVADAFVAKLNPQGSTLIYSTYLGGSSNDEGRGIAVDANFNAYVTGLTTSTNFPLKNPLQSTSGGKSDTFVAKLNSLGSALIYSTYLGGSSNDESQGIAVDANLNAHVTGFTRSTNFPTKNPLQPSTGGAEDAFITKLNQQGSALVYSTYLGGSKYDNSSGIAVDAKGEAYVKGYTYSTNFPTKNPFQANSGGSYDNFVAKLNQQGSALVYSTYLGGSGVDLGNGIAVDANGSVYITGSTTSINFPTKNPLQPTIGGAEDAFITKLNQQGSALIYSTYLGGSKEDRGNSIDVDVKGNAYVTGLTYSKDFPTKKPLQPNNYDFGNQTDTAFVTKITP